MTPTSPFVSYGDVFYYGFFVRIVVFAMVLLPTIAFQRSVCHAFGMQALFSFFRSSNCLKVVIHSTICRSKATIFEKRAFIF